MKTISRYALVLALVSATSCISHMATAQDKRPRDSSGTVMDLSKWHAMPTHEFMLNIVDLRNAKFTRAERRVRNKGIPHERVWFDNRRGFIFAEHIYTGVYNEYVTDRIKSGEAIDKLLDLFGRNRGQTYAVEEKRRNLRLRRARRLGLRGTRPAHQRDLHHRKARVPHGLGEDGSSLGRALRYLVQLPRLLEQAFARRDGEVA